MFDDAGIFCPLQKNQQKAVSDRFRLFDAILYIQSVQPKDGRVNPSVNPFIIAFNGQAKVFKGVGGYSSSNSIFNEKN
jgi:hypothetical protein